jgi:hypothetical protein
VNVDTECAGLPDEPGHVRTAAGELLPAAAPAGADHYLSNLMLPRECGNGRDGIVIAGLEPATTDLPGQFTEPVDRLAVAAAGPVASDDMQDVETDPDPCRDTRGAPNQCLIAGGSADGDHDALGCLPPDRRLLPAEMVDKLLVGLIGEEPVQNAHDQAARVARARHLTISQVLALVRSHTSSREWDFPGEPTVNVLELNLTLGRLA